MAKIDVTAIEGYETMSDAEKLTAVLGMDIPDSGEVEKLRNQISSKNSEISEWKKKHNALLDEDQRKQNEIEEMINDLKEQNAALLKSQTLSSFTAKLLARGFSSEEASKAANVLVEGKIEDFLEKNLADYRTSIERSIKAEFMKNNPQPSKTGGTDSVITKEKYNAMSMHDKMLFMAEHPDDYEKLKGE